MKTSLGTDCLSPRCLHYHSTLRPGDVGVWQTTWKPCLFPWCFPVVWWNLCFRELCQPRQSKPLLSPRQACAAGPWRTTVSPPLRAHPSSSQAESLHTSQHRISWCGKLNQAGSFPVSYWQRPQTSPLQVASCRWLPDVLWPGPCSRKHLITLTALSVINQLFFSPAFLVIKVLRGDAAPKNWVPSARVLHPSLLPKLLVSSTSLWVCET